jgi:F-type H+-transporting ATPase subunit beta
MTPTATAKKSEKAEKAAGVGRISRVTGPVVDIEFAHDSIPAMYNALKTTRSPSRLPSTSVTTWFALSH